MQDSISRDASAVAIPCDACTLGLACAGHACVFARATHPGGHTLFRQGDVPQAVHFVRRGLVLLTAVDDDGRVVEQFLRPSGSLVDVQVLMRRPHRHTATALDEMDLCTLALASADAWLGPARSPARALLELALREAVQAGAATGMTRGPASQRVAAFLLEHAGGAVPLRLQLQLVAGLLAMRPETLSRVLTRFREAGAITGRGALRVLDRAWLQGAAGGME